MAAFDHSLQNSKMNPALFEPRCENVEEESGYSSSSEGTIKKFSDSQNDATERTVEHITAGHVKREAVDPWPVDQRSHDGDQFFFSNMLRSLIPKSKQLPVATATRRCRQEAHPKRKPCSISTETKKLKCPSVEESKKGPKPVPKTLDTPLDCSSWWYPLSLPWVWPPPGLHAVPCWMSPRFWSNLPLTSASLLTTGHHNLLGKLCRDVPLSGLWLHPAHHSSRLGPVTSSPAAQMLFDRPERRWPSQKLTSGGRKIRPHHSSAFSAPRKSPSAKVPPPLAADVGPSSQDRPKPNVHYVLHNLMAIFGDIRKCQDVTVATAPTPAVAQSVDGCYGQVAGQLDLLEEKNRQDDQQLEVDCSRGQHCQRLLDKNTQTSPHDSSDCKNFSALIGLEIVVDYVKRNHKKAMNGRCASK